AAITAAGLEALDVEARGSTGLPRASMGQRPARPELVAGRALSPKQRDALELLAGMPTGIATPVLTSRGFTAHVISGLARHGYISLRQDRVDRNPFDQVSDSGAG